MVASKGSQHYYGQFLFLIVLLLLLNPFAFAAVMQQGNIVMQRTGQCDPGEGTVNASGGYVESQCQVEFIDPTFSGTARQRGIIETTNQLFFNSNLSQKTLSSSVVATLPKAKYSLSAIGTMGNLSYTSASTNIPGAAAYPAGYYAIIDATGAFYWTAYLNYNGSDLTWGAVDDSNHPWQTCLSSNNFSRATGCTDNSNPNPDPDATPNPTGNYSLFDGAGSIINAQTDCYGCNRDIASMQPHEVNSTVVFQWRYDAQMCTALRIFSDLPLPVLIQAKQWDDHDAQTAFETTLSRQQVFDLSPPLKNGWTTLSVTSLTPITKQTSIYAECAETTTPVANQLAAFKAATPRALYVEDANTQWMGTGSIISTLSRQGYGTQYDVTIASDSQQSLSTFQWQTSSRCQTLTLVDSANKSATHNAIVSIKEWNAPSFSLACRHLPCSIDKSKNGTEKYYVLKVSSTAGEFPSTLRAECVYTAVLESDTQDPVISLNGNASIEITQGQSYSDLGATATDNIDGTVSVTTRGSVDTTTLGVYTISYTATDQAGNTASTSRTVTVKAPVSTQITLTSSKLQSCLVKKFTHAPSQTELQNMRTLSCSGTYSNPISLNTNDLKNIAQLTQLTSLTLSNNKISDLSPLRALSQLTSLSLGNNKISDLSPLRELSQLKTLNLYSNKISDLSPLRSLSQLTWLDLDNNKISDLSPLRSLSQLTSLDLSHNTFTSSNLSFLLGSLSQLTSLYLRGNKISDLSPLRSLSQLTLLSLGNNKISDLSPLRSLSQLTYLYLSNNKISDLSPLRSLSQLKTLFLDNNKISDLSPLRELSQLNRLDLKKNCITNFSAVTQVSTVNGVNKQLSACTFSLTR